jgi:hypothetical protein
MARLTLFALWCLLSVVVSSDVSLCHGLDSCEYWVCLLQSPPDFFLHLDRLGDIPCNACGKANVCPTSVSSTAEPLPNKLWACKGGGDYGYCSLKINTPGIIVLSFVALAGVLVLSCVYAGLAAVCSCFAEECAPSCHFKEAFRACRRSRRWKKCCCCRWENSTGCVIDDFCCIDKLKRLFCCCQLCRIHPSSSVAVSDQPAWRESAEVAALPTTITPSARSTERSLTAWEKQQAELFAVPTHASADVEMQHVEPMVLNYTCLTG